MTSCYRVVARLFKQLPQIELTVQMHKHDNSDPEGMYAAFALNSDNKTWYLDRQGHALRPGMDQLPGTCCDYYLVQEGAALIGNDVSVLVATPDVPLVHIGGLNLWKYTTSRQPTGPLYSWMTNNKWECNFPRYIGSLFEFKYAIEVTRGAIDSSQVTSECRRLNTPFIVCRG
jgi:hypothetical protein